MDETTTLESMHKLLLEALRHREQEIFRYLAILAPALGGFVWLLYKGVNTSLFAVGTVGILLLLLLGAVYSLALGYNYRYITLQLVKLEKQLKIDKATLAGWLKSPEEFLNRYKLFCCIPWCTPPEIIKVFWFVFFIVILGIMITASRYTLHSYIPDYKALMLILITGIVSLLIGWLLCPIYFGYKLSWLCKEEQKRWDVTI